MILDATIAIVLFIALALISRHDRKKREASERENLELLKEFIRENVKKP